MSRIIVLLFESSNNNTLLFDYDLNIFAEALERGMQLRNTAMRNVKRTICGVIALQGNLNLKLL